MGPQKNNKKSTGRRVLGGVGKGVGGVFSVIGRVFAIAFLILVITGCICAMVVSVYVIKFMQTDVNIDLHSLDLNNTTILYADDAETGELYELYRLHGVENRIWVELSDIPQMVQDVVIAGEDKRFEEHQGVDWIRTVYAFLNEMFGLSEDRQGGSTLTQQLIKNVTDDSASTFERKIREIFRALNLEKQYTKDDILEAYLNTVNFGYGAYGVQAAANLYFGKDVSELTVPEAASIIASTKNPAWLNPITDPEANKERRDWIIGEYCDLVGLSDEERDAYIATPVETQRTQMQTESSEIQDYFIDTVIEEVIADLQETYGYERSYASSLIFSGGYRIYTTVNSEIQDTLEYYFENVSNLPPIHNEEYPQGACVVTDPYGRILGIVGGTGPKTNARSLNRATMSRRQPGSSIKPLTVYSNGILNNVITWSTMIDDHPFEENEDGTGWPVNFNGQYLGNITVAEAIQRSTNTVAVRLADRLNPLNLVNFLNDNFDFGLVTSGYNNDVALAPVALGAMTVGVYPIDMVGAYQMFGNGGTYTEPYSYTRVLDNEGNVILEKNITPTRILDPETAAVMNKLLQSVTDPTTYGTASSVRWGEQVVGGKTGTTSNDYDHWFIGYSPYYVCGLWIGYDESATINYSGYSYPPLVLWRNIMRDIHEDLPVKGFDDEGTAVAMSYCTETGGLATANCPSSQIGYYKPSFIPSTCTKHLSGSEMTEEDDEDEDGEEYEEIVVIP